MELSLHGALEASAKKHPNKIAYICRDEELSYAQLDLSSAQIARSLHQRGIKKSEPVGVFLGRQLLSPIAVYGILKAGSPFVPLDPMAPATRIAEIINDTGIRFLISDDSWKRQLIKLLQEDLQLDTILGVSKELSSTTLSWDSIRSVESNYSTSTSAEDPAYIMFTSGSTGRPKGIVHTHVSGTAYARLSSNLYGLSSDDVVLSHSPLHYDISTFGYLSCPRMGATCVIASDAEVKMPVSLASLAAKHRITIWYSVPLALKQVQSAIQQGHQVNLESLRWILYGGEVYHPRDIKALAQHCPAARWSNVYGPAEVNQCTYHHFDPAEMQEETDIPIGKVWDETDFLIDGLSISRDSSRPGELMIHSSTMMKHYWKREEDASMFFIDQVGKRYYRTGDLLSMENGLLRFHGRIDRQVKIKGQRVEIKEVEAALMAIWPDRELTVAAVIEDGEKILIASVVNLPDQSLQAEALKELRQVLPAHCIPHDFLGLDIIPRSPAGKIDQSFLQTLWNDQKTR